MSITDDQFKLISKLYRELRQLEVNRDHSFSNQPISNQTFSKNFNFTKAFQFFEQLRLSGNDSLVVQKILEIKKHLHPEMTAQSLACQIVPLERVIGKNVEDSDILVSTSDYSEPAGPPIPLIIALDNIRSRFNIGSIFRTADCVRAEKIYLCGYSYSPSREEDLEKKGLRKTSMGADQFVPWESHAHIRTLISTFKSQGFKCIAFETTPQALSLYENFNPKSSPKTVFIFGNERFGLDLDILKLVDEVRKIPLSGYKNSLNVATAAAVCAFEWRRQYEQS